MTAEDKYKGEDGGLYGGGKNEPPRRCWRRPRRKRPRSSPSTQDGKPAKDGKIGLVSHQHVQRARWSIRSSRRSPMRTRRSRPWWPIVDCAQGGADDGAVGQSQGQGVGRGRPERLTDAEVSPEQVQVAWVKLANARPTGDADRAWQEAAEGHDGSSCTTPRSVFPNLRIAYLLQPHLRRLGHARSSTPNLMPMKAPSPSAG